MRYDLDTQFTGYTIFNAFAIWSKLRRYFKYEFARRERLGDQELVVIKFEQTEFVKNLFGLRLFEKLNVTGPLMRGQYWLDRKPDKFGASITRYSFATTPSRGRSRRLKPITISPPASSAFGCHSVSCFSISIR